MIHTDCKHWDHSIVEPGCFEKEIFKNLDCGGCEDYEYEDLVKDEQGVQKND